MGDLQKVKLMLSAPGPNDSIPDLLLRIFNLIEGATAVGLARRVSEDQFQVSTVVGEADSLQGFKFVTGEGFLGHVVATGQPGHWSEITHDPRSAPFVERGILGTSIFCYPVIQRHQAVRVLFTILSESQKETPDLIDILFGIISQHVLADVLEERLQISTTRLSSIMELSHAMMAVEEMKNILYILLDMSLNLVQGPYSCIVFKHPTKDSCVEFLSRGVSRHMANKIGPNLANTYIGRSLDEIQQHGIPVIHQYENVQQIECPMYLRNEVVAVLAVAVTNSAKTEEFSQLLYVLSVMGNAALQRISTGYRQDLSRDIELVHRTSQFWTKDTSDQMLEIRELATAFARHIQLPDHTIQTIEHAAMLSMFDLEFVTELLPGVGDKVLRMLTERAALTELYKFPDKSSEINIEDFSKGALILVLTEHYHKKTSIDLDKIRPHLREQFDLFVLQKDVQTQEIPMCDRETFPNNVRIHQTLSQDMLTAREQEVLELLATGKGNREIAQKLFISEHTVKNHLTNIFQKLGVNDRLHAVAYVYHNL